MTLTLPATSKAWTFLRENLIGLRRDRGRSMILKGCERIMNADPSSEDQAQTRAILTALVAMNEAEIRRAGLT